MLHNERKEVTGLTHSKGTCRISTLAANHPPIQRPTSLTDQSLQEKVEAILPGYPSELLHERIADAVVHGLALIVILIAGTALMISAAIWASAGLVVACAIYCFGLLGSFAVSASYHLLPWHNARQVLRRLDHVAIYALIAGTFTPLLVQIGTGWAYVVLGAIWLLAIPAMIYKLVGSNIEPSWSLASYLGLGWMGVLAIPEFGDHLSATAIAAILVGGSIYTAGTYFYVKKVQPYRHAIWHSFVLTGTAFLFVAIWTTVFADVAIAG